MARMRNVVMKPAGWIKKHWVKIVVAIIVIGVLYWLFGSDVMEGAVGTATPQTSAQIATKKDEYDAAVTAYKSALADYNNQSKPTYLDRDGTNVSGANNCSKTSNSAPDGSGTKYDEVSGCKGFLDAKTTTMQEKWTEYAPYAPADKKKKKKRSLNSRIRRFFGMR